MAAPLIILYGASIVILKFVNPEKNGDEEETTDIQTADSAKTKSIDNK
jgi:Sec-independent protein secretion pathway component TatC